MGACAGAERAGGSWGKGGGEGSGSGSEAFLGEGAIAAAASVCAVWLRGRLLVGARVPGGAVVLEGALD
eukprot:5224792-Pleurochrysis_carterae.AAC.1